MMLPKTHERSVLVERGLVPLLLSENLFTQNSCSPSSNALQAISQTFMQHSMGAARSSFSKKYNENMLRKCYNSLVLQCMIPSNVEREKCLQWQCIQGCKKARSILITTQPHPLILSFSPPCRRFSRPTSVILPVRTITAGARVKQSR